MAPSSSSSSSSSSIIFRALFYLCTLCFLSLTTKAAPAFISSSCSIGFNYAPNSTYKNNLNTLLSNLSSNSNTTTGFYNFTAGTATPDAAYGLFLCRGDVSAADCQECVSFAVTDVVARCPSSKVVTIWYDPCMVRYSNQYIFSVWDAVPALRMAIPLNLTGVTSNQLAYSLRGVVDDIVKRASESHGKKFATSEAILSKSRTLYARGQCTPDLNSSDCAGCLRDERNSTNFPDCCWWFQGATFLFPSCNIRYEIYPFYNATATSSPPSPSPVPPPPPPSPSRVLPSPPPPPTGSGKGGISSRVLTAIIVSVGLSVLLFIIGFCFLRRRAKKKFDILQRDTIKDEILDVKSLLYDLDTIQAATNNFCDDNKIGEGGFGPVYKGGLPNGEEIAVKRLSQSSAQGAIEFKNELVLVAKLRHKSLVRLLGFCLKGEERILVYEFVPNKSLDYFLFDPQQQMKLDWSKRYNIIVGIARGMLYLHEDSPLRIIHRDLKASNILLDRDMNPKISDFGMARIFKVDQTEENTSRVVGTFGYMSPEYIMQGQFSAKSDIFSFGVLVLEIITGKKNNKRFDQSSFAEDLLSYAWRLWRDETPLNLMNSTFEGSYSRNEVIRCIHIALLCVQENPNERPSMPMVVLMLNNYSISMPLPQHPAFFTRSKRQSRNQGSDQSTSKSISLSVNEASITELDPR